MFYMLFPTWVSISVSEKGRCEEVQTGNAAHLDYLEIGALMYHPKMTEARIYKLIYFEYVILWSSNNSPPPLSLTTNK